MPNPSRVSTGPVFPRVNFVSYFEQGEGMARRSFRHSRLSRSMGRSLEKPGSCNARRGAFIKEFLCNCSMEVEPGRRVFFIFTLSGVRNFSLCSKLFEILAVAFDGFRRILIALGHRMPSLL